MSEFATCPDCEQKVKLKAGRSSAECPACGVKVSAPKGNAPAARRAKDDDDRKPEKKKPKRKYREEWDEDDDDDRSNKPAKSGGSLAWLWILLGVLALVVAVCGGLIWGVASWVGGAREDLAARRKAEQEEFDRRWNGVGGPVNFGDVNRPGKGQAPVQADASTYPKKKPYEVDPALANPSPVYLADLEPYDVTQGDWKYGRHGAMGATDNRWVVVNKAFYDHSIAMHPPNDGTARANFAVGGLVKTFAGQVALNDEGPSNNPAWGEVTFTIYKDGKQAWRSKPMKNRGTTEPFNIDMTNARVIMIETKATGNSHNAHAVWLDPTLSK